MISKLYVEPSSLCNLNCNMCFRNNWFDENTGLMSPETQVALFEEFKNLEPCTIFLGGMGEPLIHPDIIQMLRHAKVSGHKIELITNATLLNKDMIYKLREVGLDFLWVSMDGFSKESYEAIRKGSMYSLIVDNLAEFNRHRANTELGITFVMMEENEYELQNINAFADSVQANWINLSHVIPGEALDVTSALYNKSYPIGKMRRLTTRIEKKEENVCPFIKENVCFIRWDGEVSPCMQLLHNSYSYLYTERRKIYAKSYGNINRQRLMDILDSPEYITFRKNVSEFNYPCCTICMGCEDRKENKIDCMYNQTPTCGACLWAQGLVRCP